MNRFKNILVYANTHLTEDPGLQKAFQLAATNRARVTVVDDIGEVPRSALSRELHRFLSEEKKRRLETIRCEGVGRGLDIRTELVIGTGYLEVVRRVLRDGHDLVVKTSEMVESDGPLRRFSATDKHLMRKCPCPVWLVRNGRPRLFQKIVAAVNPGDSDPGRDELNPRILQLAFSLAEMEAAEVSILHVWSAEGESLMKGRYPEESIDNYVRECRDEAESRMAKLLSGFGLTANDGRVIIRKGRPAAAIPDYVRTVGADCVIMGTLARQGILGLLIGNTAEQVLDAIDCSVLTLKPADFVTPIRKPEIVGAA